MTAAPGTDVRELAEAVLVELLAEATNAEAYRIVSAAVRAGLMWKCACNQPNYPAHATCAGCRAARPEAAR